MNASKFQRGSGCYTCQACGRKTRATGRNENEHVGLCAPCYDLAGIENDISDHGETPALLAEAARLRSLISSHSTGNGQ